MPNTTAPAVASTIGLKNMVIAPLTSDTEEGVTYGALQSVAGAIDASVTPSNADPDVQFYDDVEGSVLYGLSYLHVQTLSRQPDAKGAWIKRMEQRAADSSPPHSSAIS